MTDEDRRVLLAILATAQRAEAAAVRAEGAALRSAEQTAAMLELLSEDEPDLLDEPQRTLEGEDAGRERDGSRSLDE